MSFIPLAESAQIAMLAFTFKYYITTSIEQGSIFWDKNSASVFKQHKILMAGFPQNMWVLKWPHVNCMCSVSCSGDNWGVVTESDCPAWSSMQQMCSHTRRLLYYTWLLYIPVLAFRIFGAGSCELRCLLSICFLAVLLRGNSFSFPCQ